MYKQVFSYPSTLMVNSHKTAEEFLRCLKPGQSIDITDVEQKSYYFSFMRGRDEKAETFRFGYGKYGKDAILADPVLMQEKGIYKNFAVGAKINAVDCAYLARKSINAYLRDR